MSGSTMSLSFRHRNRNAVLSVFISGVSLARPTADGAGQGGPAPRRLACSLEQTARRGRRARDRQRNCANGTTQLDRVASVTRCLLSIQTPGWRRVRSSSGTSPSAVRPRSGTARYCGRTWIEIVVGAECNIQDLCCIHVDPGRARHARGSRQPGPRRHRARRLHRDRRARWHRRRRAGRRAESVPGPWSRRARSCLPARRCPPGVLAAGVPCRIVRELTEADRQIFAETAARYVRHAARHRTVAWADPASET